MEMKMVCVTGGTGFLASQLIKRLLEKGYNVNATVRDPENPTKVSHLRELQSLGNLKLFRADLTEEGSFDAAVRGCDYVFHVAAPVNLNAEDPESELIKPTIQGTLNVMASCVKAGSVKRIIYTSSGVALTINRLEGTDLILNEESWTDIEFLTSEKPPTWGYAVSKTLAEKEAWKYAQENNIDLVTVVLPLILGSSLTVDVPISIRLAVCLLLGDQSMIDGLKFMQILFGTISIVHVEDVCQAHIFLAEIESASGRYICCSINTSVPKLAAFLANKYPQYKVPTDFGDLPEKSKLSLSSEKLIQAGFNFNYKQLEEIYDDTVNYCKTSELLQK